MVLLDTSIWIRNWAGREPYVAECHRLLRQRLAAGHAMVHGELLMGGRPGHRRAVLLDDIRILPWLPEVPHDQVAAVVRSRALAGRGMGWVGANLLASALAAGARLWTADAALAEAAEEAGVAWRP
ncbi:MAG: type II toxin-antitoxin system VapC family toxin [Terriglobales bacterium]